MKESFTRNWKLREIRNTWISYLADIDDNLGIWNSGLFMRTSEEKYTYDKKNRQCNVAQPVFFFFSRTTRKLLNFLSIILTTPQFCETFKFYSNHYHFMKSNSWNWSLMSYEHCLKNIRKAHLQNFFLHINWKANFGKKRHSKGTYFCVVYDSSIQF